MVELGVSWSSVQQILKKIPMHDYTLIPLQELSIKPYIEWITKISAIFRKDSAKSKSGVRIFE